MNAATNKPELKIETINERLTIATQGKHTVEICRGLRAGPYSFRLSWLAPAASQWITAQSREQAIMIATRLLDRVQEQMAD